MSACALHARAGYKFSRMFGEETPEDRGMKELAQESSRGNRCRPDFATRIRQTFYRNNGPNTPRLVDLYDDIRKKVMKDCSKKFSKKITSMENIRNSVEYLGMITDEYRVGQEDTDGEAPIVMRVINVMRASQPEPIGGLYEFKSLFNNEGPCAVLYRKLTGANLSEYVDFLRLAAVQDYYPFTPEAHLRNVDALGACDHIKNTHGLLEHAYEAIK